MDGAPRRFAPETANVILPIVPAVLVVNEYEYETFVAETWLFETDQLMLVSVAAPAGSAVRASRHVPIAAAPRASRVHRFRDRMTSRFGEKWFMSFLSGRNRPTIAGIWGADSVSGTPSGAATPG